MSPAPHKERETRRSRYKIAPRKKIAGARESGSKRMHKENREAARSRYKINSNSAKYTYIGVEYDWTTERLSSIVCVQHACRKLRPSANMWSKTKCAASVDLLRSKERQTPASAIFWHDRWREIADCKTRKLFPLFAAATRRWQNPQVLSISHAQVTKPPMDHFPKKSWMIYRWGRHYTSEALKPRLCLLGVTKLQYHCLVIMGKNPKFCLEELPKEVNGNETIRLASTGFLWKI